MFLSSSASAFVESEKQFHSSSSEMKHPQFIENCKKLLLLSLLPEHPSFGLFQELQNTVACKCCHKESFFVFDHFEKEKKRKENDKGEFVGEYLGESQHEYYCVICYVDRFCNVHTFQNHDGFEHYIFKEKGNGGKIIYQSSSTIQRLICSNSE